MGGKAMAVIVIPDRADPKVRIGAKEINDRVLAFGDSKLPVQTLSEFRRQPAGPIAIAIDVPELTGFSTTIERVQGYEIRTTKQQMVAISGADPQGALYGCVTACALVSGGSDGVVLREAGIADWPDFRHRASDGLSLVGHMFGLRRYSFDEGLRRGKEGIDWALRRKLNHVRTKLPDGVSPPHPDKAQEATKLFVELCQYAKARGIRVIFMTHAKIGTVKGHANGQRFKGLHRFRNYFFCWSRDELIAESAGGVTEFVRAVGPQTFFFHFPDIHENNWAERCEKCKQRFGDDRAAGDANVINAFASAVSAGHPDATALFVMQPYNMNFDLPQNEKWAQYYGRLSVMIPEDVYFCQRECSDAEARSWRRIVRQPIFYYHEPQAFIPRRPFSCATRFAKTFFFDDDRDIYFSPVSWTSLPVFRVQELATAEYSWNTHAPGSDCILHDPSGVVWSGRDGDYCRERRRVGEMDYNEWLWLEGGGEPREVGRTFLERACRLVYGREIGHAMAAGHRSGITTEREYWAGPASLDLVARARIAEKHFQGAQAACAALDPLFPRHASFTDPTRMVYLRLLKLNHVFKVVADVQRHLLRAQVLAASCQNQVTQARGGRVSAFPGAVRGAITGALQAGRLAVENGSAELSDVFGRFSLEKVSDNYRLRCGGLKEALAAVSSFSGGFDLLDKQLRAGGAEGVASDLLFSCTFDEGKAEAAFARSSNGSLEALRSNVQTVAGGKTGQAAEFPRPAVLVFPASGNIDPARGTIEMWVKPNWHWNDNERHVFFTARAADDGWRRNRMWLVKNVNYSLNFSVADKEGRSCIAAIRPNVFKKGEWIHLSASWDNARGVRLFVNGSMAAEAKGSWGNMDLTRLWIGSDPAGDRNASSLLDEVRVRSGARGF